jgi:hypothetical protein
MTWFLVSTNEEGTLQLSFHKDHASAKEDLIDVARRWLHGDDADNTPWPEDDAGQRKLVTDACEAEGGNLYIVSMAEITECVEATPISVDHDLWDNWEEPLTDEQIMAAAAAGHARNAAARHRPKLVE